MRTSKSHAAVGFPFGFFQDIAPHHRHTTLIFSGYSGINLRYKLSETQPVANNLGSTLQIVDTGQTCTNRSMTLRSSGLIAAGGIAKSMRSRFTFLRARRTPLLSGVTAAGDAFF